MTPIVRRHVKGGRDGAIAQLGERVVRNDEVGGSIPPGSTTLRLRLRVAQPRSRRRSVPGVARREIGYRLEVWHQAAGQPNQHNVALALPLKSAGSTALDGAIRRRKSSTVSTPSEKAARQVMLVLSVKGLPDIFSHWHLNPLFEPNLWIAGHSRISSHRQGRVN